MKLVGWGTNCATVVTSEIARKAALRCGVPQLLLLLALVFGLGATSMAQVNVLTAHNDNARDGANTQETILTPANVSAPNSFGKIFTLPVNGGILAQPLYVSNLAINNVPHNVVFVATTLDYVYAFDADTNGGTNAKPLWQANLLAEPAPTGAYSVPSSNLGDAIVGTPVIDTTTKTIYLVSYEQYGAVAAPAFVFRFHALDITTGAEKFGGPIQIQASVPGNGNNSTGGTLTFDPSSHQQRAGLLLQNGVVYAAFGSISDGGAWHGWIFSFAVNPNTQQLQQLDAFCTTPNGTGGGIWQSGAGLVGEVYNPAKPYGRMFVAIANGSAVDPNDTQYSGSSPYYSMSVIDFDLTGGQMTVDDIFTPHDAVAQSTQDGDLGSGGPVLLPTQTLASGQTYNPILEIGKTGKFYLLDRDNATDGSNVNSTYTPAGLGGYNANSDSVVQELQTPILLPPPAKQWGAGVWGTEAYWNNTIYLSGINPELQTSMTAWPLVNGVLKSSPTSASAELYGYAPPTPAVSANGEADGIVWILKTDNPAVETLLAYDATNLGNTLYSSNTNVARDNPGASQAHDVPTIANGKVYVAAGGQLAVYGLLGPASQITTPAPTISPLSTTFATQVVATISAVNGATIYYTTNGTLPNSNSPVYRGPITIAANTTLTAVASVTGQIQSPPASQTYLSQYTPGNPAFTVSGSPVSPLTYSGPQTLTITSTSASGVNPTIYYTTDGVSLPSASSPVYTGPITISSSVTVQAIAIGVTGGETYSSAITSATYTILPVDQINFSAGIPNADGLQLNGVAAVGDDTRLQLTDGNPNEAGSVFFENPVNIQGFTTNFTFQLSPTTGIPGDGITFTIQNAGPRALGGYGGSLGYAGIAKSVAVKFDIYNNAGEGNNSTGLYVNGAIPTVPAIPVTGVSLTNPEGNAAVIGANLTYNGTNLTLTLYSPTTFATLFTYSWVINIPAIVGGNTAYVGFTGGSGYFAASQKIESWTYLAGAPVPNYTDGFTAAGMVFNGYANLANGESSAGAINGTRLRLTDGNSNGEARSAYYAAEVNVQQFTTSFDFQNSSPTSGDGFTFVVQGSGPTALGGVGGSMGYGGIPKSVAVKFDLYYGSAPAVNGVADYTGLYTNGAVPESTVGVNLSGTGINLHSNDIFNVRMTYDGTTLTVAITDLKTKATATQAYAVNIPLIVGGGTTPSPTAYVGFTGGSGGATAIQEILNWTFNALPIPQPVFPGGFAGGANLFTINGNASLTAQRLRLTDGFPNETSSAFFTAPVNIQQFHTGFQFRLTNPNADGFTFTIQNTSPTALGGAGGGLGYSGIGNSVAIKFDLYSNSGEGPDSTGIYTDGIGPGLPAINLAPSGIDLHNGDAFDVQMTYDGTTLTVVLLDMVTGAVSTNAYPVNIPGLVGGNTAYVGFTGASGGQTAIQDILNWSYAPGLPASPWFTAGFANAGYQFSLNGGALVNGAELELTDGGPQEMRSAFYTTQVNVQQFDTSFNFQIGKANADGFTFTIQGVNPTVIGYGGGGLGFDGLAQSVGVKFDLYNNAGEGASSTGVYTDGAMPAVPSTNLIPLGINLHSGDIVNVQISYNGAVLLVTTTDTVTKASATQSYTLNIPAIVGGSTAYVGFTGASGSLTAIQQILNWTYTPVDSI